MARYGFENRNDRQTVGEVKLMERLSEERLKNIEEFFRNPPPKSKTAQARDFGVDSTCRNCGNMLPLQLITNFKLRITNNFNLKFEIRSS